MYHTNILKGEAMNKLYLALVCLTVTAFAVSTSVDANYRRGRRNCANGMCERKEKSCKTCPVKRERSCKKECAVCPSCPVNIRVHREKPQSDCIVEKYCKLVSPERTITIPAKYEEVECVTQIKKECCVKEGVPCSPEAASNMTDISNAPGHVQKAMETNVNVK